MTRLPPTSYYYAHMGRELASAVAARFYAVNGRHPMTPEDDAYVSEWFVPVEELKVGQLGSPGQDGGLLVVEPSVPDLEGAQSLEQP